LQFDGFIDLDAYDTIALKLKGDGRCYISTVSILSPDYVIRETNRKSALTSAVVALL
jgi:hypothetical protein